MGTKAFLTCFEDPYLSLALWVLEFRLPFELSDYFTEPNSKFSYSLLALNSSCRSRRPRYWPKQVVTNSWTQSCNHYWWMNLSINLSSGILAPLPVVTELRCILANKSRVRRPLSIVSFGCCETNMKKSKSNGWNSNAKVGIWILTTGSTRRAIGIVLIAPNKCLMFAR